MFVNTGEKLMEKEFVEKMKKSLLELKKQILESLAENNTEYKQIVDGMRAQDVIDIASDVVDSRMLETMSTKDSNRLTAINNALTRIEQGKYGLCLKCGKKIPKERLAALPYAALCINCKASDEKHNR